ncbi:hypothetical protein BJY52DRAFT_1194634 [Lactarius psammicola]|nr:hypothetical protein BJY52DRAFT_1194634 [Lactarius psammicola]
MGSSQSSFSNMGLHPHATHWLSPSSGGLHIPPFLPSTRNLGASSPFLSTVQQSLSLCDSLLGWAGPSLGARGGKVGSEVPEIHPKPQKTAGLSGLFSDTFGSMDFALPQLSRTQLLEAAWAWGLGFGKDFRASLLFLLPPPSLLIWVWFSHSLNTPSGDPAWFPRDLHTSCSLELYGAESSTPPSPQHVPWSQDPVPSSPAIDPNDTGHLLAHIKTFTKDPIPSQPYHQVMDAGFNPNTPPAPEVTHQTQYGVKEDNFNWLLSSSPLEPVGSAERQGTAPNRHHLLPPIETMSPLPASSFQSLQSTVQYSQNSVQEITAEGVPVRTGLSDATRRFIREATANLRAIRTARTPNRLPDITRQIIKETVEERNIPVPSTTTPEVIFVRSSVSEPCDVVIPPLRPESVASLWTHVTHETEDPDSREEIMSQFPELRIRDFVESINDALRAPVLTEPSVPTIDPSWDDEDEDLERIQKELMVELGRDVSDSQTVGFNLSVALVIAALDCGVEDNRGDLEQAGVTPSSWFRLASGILGVIARGALRSGGRKIQGCVCLDDDDDTDTWTVQEGLAQPVTQGGRIAAQADQIVKFFTHYAGTEEPPLAEFYNSVLRVGQNHIEKVVRLKAAATYQITTSDVQGLTDMVLDDMSRQLYTHMVTDETAWHRANQRSLDCLFVEAQQQLAPFMEEWKGLYKHSLVQALKEDENDREESPEPTDPLLRENLGYIKLFAFNRAKDIRDSIARVVTDPILDGDEISRAQEQKKAWAVAFRDSNKLDFLTKAAAELGYVLIRKDDVEEREGRTTKHRAILDGKRSRSGSRAEGPASENPPVTPTHQPVRLDTSTTPKARKTKSKGKRALVIPKPIRSRSVSLSSTPSEVDEVMADPLPPPPFFASSYPLTAQKMAEATEKISNISVPALVRPSQEPGAPLRDPRRYPSEPATDVTVEDVPPAAPSRVATPDSSRGVASSMHNPLNAMVDDPQSPPTETTTEVPLGARPIQVTNPKTPLTSIPLMPGLAEMLTALQNNLVTTFTSQIAGLVKRIDDQDSVIKSITTRAGNTKSKGPSPENANQTRPTSNGHAPGPPPNPTGCTGVAPDAPITVPTPNPGPVPVPDPTAAPIPPPRPRGNLPRAIQPPLVGTQGNGTRWAAVITNSNFAANTSARDASKNNANSVGRTASGAAQGGKGVKPDLTENTEITVVRGSGLKDKNAEDRLYKSNPGGVVQAARSHMERMSAQAPAVLYGRWSVNANSHNFVYVFAGKVPFSTVLQYSQALTEPLGGGNLLPNKGWTFAQLRGVPTSDGQGVIHEPDKLLEEVQRAPFFTDAIFVSKPHWQLNVTALAHASTGAVQLAFIDESGACSAAAKAQGVGMFGLRCQFFLTGSKPYFTQCGRCHEVGHATNAPACHDPYRGWPVQLPLPVSPLRRTPQRKITQLSSPTPSMAGAANKSTNSTKNADNTTPPQTDADGFTLVGKPVGAQARKGKKKKSGKGRREREAAASAASTSGANGIVQTVLFPDDLATISQTIDAFRKIAYEVSNHVDDEDFRRALDELEEGWGSRTSDLDNLFCLPARYAVKHLLPLTIPHTEEEIARGSKDKEEAAARVAKFRSTWGDSRPYHYTISQLPQNTRFATPKEVEEQRISKASSTEKAKMYSDTVTFTLDLTRNLYENGFTSRPLMELEADILIVDHSLERFFHPDNTALIGDTIADAIKNFIQQDAARLFRLANSGLHA